MERKEIEIKLNEILETLSDEIGYEKTSIKRCWESSWS